MFNLMDTGSGDKVDFWVLTDEPFDRSRFGRRRAYEVGGQTLLVSSPEDTILMKLKWAKESGGSEKQLGDALNVYELQHAGMDMAYLDEWACRLGVEDLLERLVAEAEPL